MKIWSGFLTQSENLLGIPWSKHTILAESFAEASKKLEAKMKMESPKLKLQITKLELIDEVDVP